MRTNTYSLEHYKDSKSNHSHLSRKSQKTSSGSFKRSAIAILIVFLFLPFTFCENVKNNFAATSFKIKDKTLYLEIADTYQKRKQGLMFREKIDINDGMLFVYSSPKFLSFWMKNTSIPLSIAYIDKRGRITQIESLKPHEIKPVRSKQKCLFALEVNQHWFLNNNINIGDTLDLSPLKETNLNTMNK